MEGFEKKVKTKAKKRKGIARIFPSNPVYTVIVILMALLAAAFLAMMAMVNAFPANMTMTLVAVMLVMLILAFVLLGRKKRVIRVLGLLVAILFMAGYGLATYYLGTTYAAFTRIATKDSVMNTGFDITKEPFNIYITGIDQFNAEKGLDLERSDVNMIVTVNPKIRTVLLTSIPRDSYVRLHTAGEMDKLTHTGVYGVDETINTVQDWLGIKLDYYVKVNFTAVVNIVNAMGGITIESPIAFKSSIAKYKYKKGKNTLSGREALYFARERKAFEGKDSIRVENQQIVVRAMLNKLTTSSTLLNSYSDILDAAADDLETNMPISDMQALVRMQLEDLGEWDIQVQKIEGEYDMDYVASLTQEQKFQVYRTDEDSVEECLENIYALMNPSEEEVKAYENERAKKKKEENWQELIYKLRGNADENETSSDK